MSDDADVLAIITVALECVRLHDQLEQTPRSLRLRVMHRMRTDGWPLQRIGDMFGVSRERVRQLLKGTM